MNKILSGQVGSRALQPYFQERRFVAINSIVSSVAFPRAYSSTPSVMVTPGPGATWARVTRIYPQSFEWRADVGGASASWLAWGDP